MRKLLAVAQRLLLGPEPSRNSAAATMRVLLLATAFGLIAFYWYDWSQAVTVEARTNWIEVETVDDPLNEWSFERVVFCERRETRELSIVVDDTCGPVSLFTAHAVAGDAEEEEATVRWGSGWRLVMRPSAAGGFEVLVSSADGAAPEKLDFAGAEVRPGSRLVLPWSELDRLGGLRVRGKVTLGESPVSTAAQHFLISGRYELREKIPLQPSGKPVADGELVFGDQVSVRMDADRIVPGWLLIGRGGDGAAFEAVLTTPPERGGLRLARIGSEPAIIEINIAQRLQGHPFPIFVSTVLGLLGASLGVLNQYLPRTPPAPAPVANGTPARSGRKPKPTRS